MNPQDQFSNLETKTMATTFLADNGKYLSLIRRDVLNKQMYFLEASKVEPDIWSRFKVIMHADGRISISIQVYNLPLFHLKQVECKMPYQEELAISIVAMECDPYTDPDAKFRVVDIWDQTGSELKRYKSLVANNGYFLGRIERTMPDYDDKVGMPIEASKNSYCDPFARFEERRLT